MGFLEQICDRARGFAADRNANVAVTFAIALVPVLTGVGAAVDFSRASSAKSALQLALDSAVLAGAKDGSSNWVNVAQNVFSGNFSARNISFETPSFGYVGDNTYSAAAKAKVPTSILGLIKIDTLDVTATASAMAAEADDSCILTLDRGAPLSHVSLSLNGAPVVNLSGCSIRSNTSLACNGHDGDVMKSYAGGVASECGRSKSNAAIVPDTYAERAKNITRACGTSRPGVTWFAGSIPTGSGVIVQNNAGYVEYHICGDLTLAGTGHLTSGSPADDIVIVIENGSLHLDNHASINTARTAIILTGDGSWPAKIDFPNGAGKQATLSLSPPTTAGRPWYGVALFLDPKLTTNVNNTWGPGANFSADGLVYLGNSNVVTDGNTSSANSRCTKFVMNSFVTNGAVRLDFAQQNCAAIGLQQWTGIIVHLRR